MIGNLRRPASRRHPSTTSAGRAARRLASVTVLVATSALLSPAVASAVEGPAQPDVAAIDRFIDDEIRAAAIPGAAVAITRGDQVVHVRGFGHDSDHQPVTARTLFRIASLSKSFTSLAVLQLVDAGRLSLEDPVVTHLPEFRTADPRSSEITVRQLLDQTSGLADRAFSELDRTQPTSLVEATAGMSAAEMVAAPGAQWNYHNPNYHVAARLVEVVSGERFETYLRDHVFEPAGMTASLTTLTGVDPVAGLAAGHLIAYGRPIVTEGLGTFEAGAGGVVSTATDMASWLVVHTNGGRAADGARLVSEVGLTELLTASAPNGYALGWDTEGPGAAPTRVEHSGNLLTYSGFQAVLPASGYGVALLFNSGSALLREQSAIFEGVVDLLTGHAPSAGPRFSTATLDAALGTLTLAVLLLGLRGVVRSRRWAARHAGSGAAAALRLLPELVVIGLVAAFPRLAELLLGVRDVTWMAAPYGWPAMAVFVVAALVAAAATLTARVWEVIRRSQMPTDGPAPAIGALAARH